jgi:ATP-dependent RNA helicase DeaD
MPKKNRPTPNAGRPKARKTKYANPAIEEAIRAATAAAKAQKPPKVRAAEPKPEKQKPEAPKAERPARKPTPPPPPVEEVEQEEAPQITFADLDLIEPIARAVSDLGFEAPTPIQAQAIPVLLKGHDMIGQAQTGTGKTAAFALPLLQICDPNTLGVQALVLEPTRELAVQVGSGIFDYGRHTGLRVATVFGGQPFDRQIRMLQSGAQIVVGTPGRILDHLRRGTLDLSNVRYCVLDEADEMLALGFIEDIETILAELPESRQTAFFSATMPPRVAGLMDRFLNDPVRVSIESKRRTVETIQQTYYDVRPGRKLDALARVLDMETPGSTIVFCRTRQETSDLADALRLRGYAAEALNGEMAQSERDRVMRRFRDGQSDLLIATDVAARGLDIESVTHVINYDIPWDVEQYIHRIGRTGRAGRAGDAITLVEGRERRQLEFIERMVGAKIAPVRVPTAADIVARRREVFTESLRQTLEARTFDGYLNTVEELSDEFDSTEIAAAAIQMLWQERHPTEAGTAEELAADHEQAEQGMTRLFIGMGRQDGLRPGDLVGAISNEAGIPGKAIGAIDILDRTSFVEVPRPDAERIIDVLRNTKIRGRKVKVEVVMGDKTSKSKDGQAKGGKQKSYRGRS